MLPILSPTLRDTALSLTNDTQELPTWLTTVRPGDWACQSTIVRSVLLEHQTVPVQEIIFMIFDALHKASTSTYLDKPLQDFAFKCLAFHQVYQSKLMRLLQLVSVDQLILGYFLSTYTVTYDL